MKAVRVALRKQEFQRLGKPRRPSRFTVGRAFVDANFQVLVIQPGFTQKPLQLADVLDDLRVFAGVANFASSHAKINTSKRRSKGSDVVQNFSVGHE